MADSDASIPAKAESGADVTVPVDDQQTNVLLPEDWNARWEKRQIGFHKDSVNEMLEKHVQQLLDGRENLRIFVPLCGKTVDIKWFADMGHRVTGIDCSEMALMEFFQDHNLDYVTEEAPGLSGKLFKSTDDKIRLYCGDLFRFNKSVDGDFDAVWDRGSFVAINPGDRQRYSELLTSLMSEGCRYLMNILVYNQRLYAGPPFASTFEEVQGLYGDSCVVEEIDSVDVTDEKLRIDHVLEKVILLLLR